MCKTVFPEVTFTTDSPPECCSEKSQKEKGQRVDSSQLMAF